MDAFIRPTGGTTGLKGWNRGREAQSDGRTERQKYRATEGRKDRGTELQRNRGTEIRRDRSIEKQKDGSSEGQKYRGTEGQNYRGSDAIMHNVHSQKSVSIRISGYLLVLCYYQIHDYVTSVMTESQWF